MILLWAKTDISNIAGHNLYDYLGHETAKTVMKPLTELPRITSYSRDETSFSIRDQEKVRGSKSQVF